MIDLDVCNDLMVAVILAAWVIVLMLAAIFIALTREQLKRWRHRKLRRQLQTPLPFRPFPKEPRHGKESVSPDAGRAGGSESEPTPRDQ